MSIAKIINAFTYYGLDVALLGFLTAVSVEILKRTLLKKLQKKVITFLPFILGIVFYGTYRVIVTLGFNCLLTETAYIIESGVTVGGAATLAYVLYEQFVREKDCLSVTENVVKTLVEGYVPSDNVERVAKEIAAAIEKDVTGNGARKAAEILKENCPDIDENSVKLLSKLIIETLAHITVSGG